MCSRVSHETRQKLLETNYGQKNVESFYLDCYIRLFTKFHDDTRWRNITAEYLASDKFETGIPSAIKLRICNEKLRNEASGWKR